MAHNAWLCQFLAAVLATPVRRPDNVESTALGAAFLAGTAAGIWPSLADTPSSSNRDAVFEPALAAAERARLIAGWRDAVARTRHRTNVE